MVSAKRHDPSDEARHEPLSAIVLAGRISPSPLRQALDVHVLCLPVGRRGSLLDAWLDALAAVPGLASVTVVVNAGEDVEQVQASLASSGRGQSSPGVRIISEPAAWRGAAGLLRDVTVGAEPASAVLVCEGKRLPPPSLLPVVETFDRDRAELAGVVGVCGVDEPAGIYLFRRSEIEHIPAIGYYDLKEQFLPSLSKRGRRVVTANLCDQVWRLRDLPTYLATVEESLRSSSGSGQPQRVSNRASVSGSAVLDGFCLIEAGAVIEDGAVIHDSVVLWGATVGGGAVVSGSVIGPLASVEPRSRVVRRTVSQPAAAGRSANRMAVHQEERTPW